MTIDLFFAGDEGTESRGSIIFENGKLTGTSKVARRIISEPLPVYGPDDPKQNGPPQFINPQEEPERFMRELPGTFYGSRFWATVREEPDATASLSPDIPLERGDV